MYAIVVVVCIPVLVLVVVVVVFFSSFVFFFFPAAFFFHVALLPFERVVSDASFCVVVFCVVLLCFLRRRRCRSNRFFSKTSSHALVEAVVKVAL